MYFGSVRFFRHLILIVLAVLIIVPTVLCFLLYNDNQKKDEEIRRLNSAVSSGTSSSVLPVTESSDETTSASSLTDSSTSEDYSHEAQSSVPDSETEPQTSKAPEQTDESSSESVPQSSSEIVNSNPQNDYTALYDDMYAEKYSGEYIKDDNTVYLTFDDGPSVLTENILYYLNQENVRATFFVVPEDTEYSRSLIKKIYDSGHTIGIHSFSHDYDKIYSSAEDFLEDFYRAYKIVYEVTGEKPSIYRFPGGSINDWNKDTIAEITAEMNRRGFVYFDWNVDSNDWQGYSWTQLYNNVTSDAFELSTPVILFHDTGARENTVLVIEDIIKALKNKGYQFGSLSAKTKPLHF